MPDRAEPSSPAPDAAQVTATRAEGASESEDESHFAGGLGHWNNVDRAISKLLTCKEPNPFAENDAVIASANPFAENDAVIVVGQKLDWTSSKLVRILKINV